MPLVAEVKLRSAKGEDLIRDRRVEDVVRAYEDAGAACISVVTGRWFGGTPGLLAEVASATRLPVLQKDFLTSRSSLARAATLGAAAVLLTRRLLARETLAPLVECALSLGLTPFLEVQSAEELAGLAVDERVIVAVNNQDIETREATGAGVARSLALRDAARATGAGAIVSASAIDSPWAAKRLLDAGFDGLLVGSSLLSAERLDDCLASYRAALASGVQAVAS
jgi:indole-3-glycerol phosphate synthase